MGYSEFQVLMLICDKLAEENIILIIQFFWNSDGTVTINSINPSPYKPIYDIYLVLN